VSRGRTLISTGAHCAVFRGSLICAVTPGRRTEPATELSSEMSVVAKTARVGDLADGLARVQQGPAVQQTRSMI
jgi:hypothetical protein